MTAAPAVAVVLITSGIGSQDHGNRMAQGTKPDPRGNTQSLLCTPFPDSKNNDDHRDVVLENNTVNEIRTDTRDKLHSSRREVRDPHLITLLIVVAVSLGSFGETFLLLLLLLFLLLAFAFCSLLWRFSFVFGFSLLAVFFLGGRGRR